MRIQTRLQRLEQRASAADAHRWALEQRDLFAEIEQGVAYLRGEGPRPPEPPCPPWFDPAVWASRLRVGRCVEDWLRGDLPSGTYLPDMDEAEQHNAEDLLQALTAMTPYPADTTIETETTQV